MPPASDDDSLTRADVVVAGSGAAGLMASIEAATHGASVVIFEKLAEIGGSTRLSGGYVALCETDLQPASGEELFADLMRSHVWDSQEDLTRLYVDGAPAMYRRLVELGLRFTGTMQFSNMSNAWGHELPLGDTGGGAQIVECLQRAARALGVRILTSTAVRRLVRDGSGTVTGVVVAPDGRPEVVTTAGAVVLASGGFTRSPSLIRTYGRPGTEHILPITGDGSHGDGLVMGMALGAATSYMARGVVPTTPVEPSSGSGCVVNYAGGILINKEGRRFCDESALYTDLCWAGLAQTDLLMVHLFDETARAAHATTMVGQVMSGGALYRSETIEGLLAQLEATVGVDGRAGLATVARYNRSVDAGCDEEFGRRNLIGSHGQLRRIATPPYFAVVAVPGTTHFNGGLRVSVEMEVLDVFDQPIPGLFAAGEITGGFHGSGYMPATHVGSALIFGRQAGRSAARQAGDANR